MTTITLTERGEQAIQDFFRDHLKPGIGHGFMRLDVIDIIADRVGSGETTSAEIHGQYTMTGRPEHLMLTEGEDFTVDPLSVEQIDEQIEDWEDILEMKHRIATQSDDLLHRSGALREIQAIKRRLKVLNQRRDEVTG